MHTVHEFNDVYETRDFNMFMLQFSGLVASERTIFNPEEHMIWL